MKRAAKKKVKSNKPKYMKRDYVAVLLEDMRGDIKAVAEGHLSLNEKIDSFRSSLDGKIDSFREDFSDFKSEMTDFKSEMTDFKSEMTDFKSETKANFKVVKDFLSRIEDELVDIKEEIGRIKADKADKREFDWLKDKVLELEKRLDKYQKHFLLSTRQVKT